MKVTFVRHAEAEHNVLMRAKKAFKHIQDPDLTQKGIDECRKLNSILIEKGVYFEILIVTPMSRAIQTALIAFEQCFEKAFLMPYGTEPEIQPNQLGMDLEGIKKKFGMFNGFSKVQFDHIQKDWVQHGRGFRCQSEANNKENQFNIIKQYEGKNIVVIGHSGKLKKYLGRGFKNLDMVEINV